ncbi:hypothetical protein D9M73_184770 [compost metagenome]
MREQRVVLEHCVDVALVRRQSGGFLSVDADGAGSRLLEAGDQAQAGGLAGAGRAEHGEEFAVPDIDGHPVDGLHLAELAGDLGELNSGGGHGERSRGQEIRRAKGLPELKSGETKVSVGTNAQDRAGEPPLPLGEGWGEGTPSGG